MVDRKGLQSEHEKCYSDSVAMQLSKPSIIIHVDQTLNHEISVRGDNTNAEGRLTLADALVYACNQGVDKIIDLATLTGACVVALGPSIAGIFTPSDELAQEVTAASELSELSGEKFWRFPMEESYWEQMKSGVADMVNTGGRQGGSITAALFLREFISNKHIHSYGS
ncbi:leucine aminopeptidase 2, chloroplastic-like [Hordeum vulgare subsp. vulgare]|uniref:leucine aminopeptidase 2, chloroplastic-like n=1 Tax=Hordeum vulgare subsp. vulgare TaxID=112509 RepID=UPI001D1A477A|nr:leucine aminopeptidase 2, chloroplastic-like [Hordeum vulgare subsp. vulgare]